MGASNSTSKPNKKPVKSCSECDCQQDAKHGECTKRKCLSLDGHYCICNIGWGWRKNYQYCKAKRHVCICNLHGPNKCKSKTQEHPCTCRDNWRILERKSHIGHCKAEEGHPCFCKFDKSKCQACY